ncbi:MAG: transporter substrate-binding domain-containing protein [Rhodospirillaceae bacterium]|jgi:polar amino acid transport system substrate-binding protein|nr:transporter substrate-binding domain-containing protein [Rhodospirillaceae bacterium]MBT5455271.1 transporter substrate-binding domain-containing protein [Rhodospirillaceae bacterium]
MDADIIAQLAPSGTLRAGLNMANKLLNTSETAAGDPDGVAADMARAIAEKLGVGVSLIRFASPGELADEVSNDIWDIGFIGAEPTRAETIDFTAAYVEIEATYLVAEDSRFQTVEDVDSDGVRIAVSGRSAYDLYLSRNLKNAELIRAQGVPGAVDLFKTGDYDALAALRPALVAEIDDLPGTRILDDRFTAVQQAIGTQKGKEKATKFLSDFVEEAKASGFVASLIEKHGVVGRLSVAQPG